MTKSGALAAELVVDGIAISNDVGSVSSMACPRGVQDVTGLNRSARETLLLTRDGSMTFAPFWNPDGVHATLSPLTRSDRVFTFLHSPAAGAAAYCLNGKQVDYDGTRAASGELTFTTSTVGNGYGAEWCEALTAGLVTSTSAENLASVDGGAATDFGAQAYLHVTAFTGTSITVTLEDSADDSSFAAITGGAFTAATGVGAQRIQTARDATIRRYVRVALTGTYTTATLLVVFNRNPVEVLF